MSQTSTAKKSVENNVETAPMQVVKIDQPIAQALSATKPEPVAPAPEPAPVPVLTLEQKINKVEDLSMLIDKWRKLQESYRSLQTFQVSTDGFTNQIILRESNNGREFRTSNTAVVARIVEEIKSTLQGKITEVEQQIRF